MGFGLPASIEQAEKWNSRAKLGGRATVTLASIDAAVFQTLFSRNIIVNWSPWWVLTPICVAAVGSLGDTIFSTKRRLNEKQRIEARDEIRQAVADLVKQVHEVTGVPIPSIGASVWRPASFRPWLWQKRLERIIRFRMDSFPAPTQVDWVKGKGAIGQCWAENREKHRSWSAISRRYQDGEFTNSEWSRMPDATRSGFTRPEFAAMCGKYSEVLAYPIQDAQGGFVAVLSIDVPAGDGEVTVDKLDTKSVKIAAQTAAKVIRRLLQQA